VLHHLLLGDSLMLAPLLAKLRARHPAAEIVVAMPRAVAPLFSGRPYRVTAAVYDPRDAGTIRELARGWPDGFDLAFVPGDNRWSWLARALGARWIVAHAGDRPAWKNWMVDEAVPYPDAPGAWTDIVAELAGGPPPPRYRRDDWPAPAARAFERPSDRYAVLHVGASTPLKFWPAEYWRELAAHLSRRGVEPVWSAGPREQPLVDAIDPEGRHRSYAGALDLPQLWALLSGAALMVSVDTGVAHLGRLVDVPTVTLFGPGSALIAGKGAFWRDSPYVAVTVEPFPCRDQTVLFRRDLAWVRRCGRGTDQCARARCMEALLPGAVLAEVEVLLARGSATAPSGTASGAGPAR